MLDSDEKDQMALFNLPGGSGSSVTKVASSEQPIPGRRGRATAVPQSEPQAQSAGLPRGATEGESATSESHVPRPLRTVAGDGANGAKSVGRGGTKKGRQVLPERVPERSRSLSGQVPEGDVRLTANIREDLHLKLKIAAARRRTTIGELIEELVEHFL